LFEAVEIGAAPAVDFEGKEGRVIPRTILRAARRIGAAERKLAHDQHAAHMVKFRPLIAKVRGNLVHPSPPCFATDCDIRPGSGPSEADAREAIA